jgi:hypothetical protein
VAWACQSSASSWATRKPRPRIVTRISTRTHCGARSRQSARQFQPPWMAKGVTLCPSPNRGANDASESVGVDHFECARIGRRADKQGMHRLASACSSDARGCAR